MEYLIPVAILAFLGAMAYFLTRSQKNESLALGDLAKEKSWNYTDKKGGFDGLYQIEGKIDETTPWKITAYAKMSTNRNMMMNVSGEYTEWSANISNSADQIYLMPKDPSMKSTQEEKIVKMLIPIWKNMGIDAEGWQLVQLSDEAISSSYLNLSNQPQLVKKLGNSSFGSILKEWSKLPYTQRPAIRLDQGKLEIQIRKALNKPEDVQHLASWGETLYSSIS